MVDLILLDKEEVREIVVEALRRKGYVVADAAASGEGARLREGLSSCSVCCAAAKAVDALQDLSRVSGEGAPLYRFVLRSIEKPLLESALAKTGGNQLAAARLLGINRNTLRARLRSLGIRPTPLWARVEKTI